MLKSDFPVEIPSRRTEDLIRERLRLDAELEQHLKLLTVIFVDIVGSTHYYEQYGDLAGLLMVQKFMDMLTPVVLEHDGTVIKTMGDAILARYQNAQTAVRCAIRMQRLLDERNAGRPVPEKIHIRVALNLGLALLKDNDVFGDMMNVAARISAATGPNEILISPSVYEQIQHVPDLKVIKKATGVELKGKSEKLDLFEVMWREVGTEVARPARPSNSQLAMATGMFSLSQLTGSPEETPVLPGMGSSPAPAPAPSPPPPRAPAAPAAVPAAPAASAAPSPKGTAILGAEKAEKPAAAGLRFMLIEVHADGTLGERYPLDRPVKIASAAEGRVRPVGDLKTAGAPEHARLTQLGDAVYVEDMSGAKGVFLRLKHPQALKEGDVLMVGRQRFRFDTRGPAPAAPAQPASPKATLVMGAGPAAPPSIPQLIRLDENDQEADRYPVEAQEVTLGRSRGTLVFPDDHYMSGLHARITSRAGQYVLEDQGSTNGTFIGIRKRALARDGDTLFMDGQLWRVLAEEREREK